MRVLGATLCVSLCACAHYDLPAVVPDPAVRESLELRTEPGARSGLTTWSVEYRYSLTEEHGRCWLRKPRVVLALRESVPWVPATGDPIVLAGLDKLTQHEEGHLRIDRAAASALARVLRSIEPQPTCAEVTRNAESAAARVLDECRAANLAYDRATAHGAR
ncbi:MAG TPA: DUF922 domain-containing protein [Myxococcales bacterium]|jgi:predicted secreted Zn-dependent protease